MESNSVQININNKKNQRFTLRGNLSVVERLAGLQEQGLNSCGKRVVTCETFYLFLTGPNSIIWQPKQKELKLHSMHGQFTA